MIPKIIHQIWLGPNSIPRRLLKARKTWQELHPEWEHKLWTAWPEGGYTDSDHPFPDIEPFSNTLSSWAQCADLLRLELIRRYGGIYVDMDIVAFKPIDDLVQDCDLFISEEPANEQSEDKVYVTNALFGACPSHAFINSLMQTARESAVAVRYCGPHVYGPRLFTGAFNVLSYREDIRVLPWHLYHSLSVAQIVNADMAISPEAYGIHLYELSWSTDAGLREAVSDDRN